MQNKEKKEATAKTPAKKGDNFIKHELKGIKHYINKLKTPTEKEYFGLLRMNFLSVAGLGFFGFFIKFVHVMINSMLLDQKETTQ